MSKNLTLIKKTVQELGGTFEEFMPERNCFYINVLDKRILLENNISITRNSFSSAQLTKCKDITHKLLLSCGLPSPKTECFYNKNFDQNKANKKLAEFNYPIIIKDACGSNSRGIFSFIQNRKEALGILQRELPKYRSMIAQKMVFGKEYRLLVLGNKIIGALEMITPHIIGDGISSVRKLINEKQNTTKQRTIFDKKFIEILKDQKTSLDSIPKKQKVIYIKKNACLAEGGETRNVTGTVNEKIQKICIAASKVVGKHLVGIDAICNDITETPTPESFHILEINSEPDLCIHYKPNHGKTQEVAKKIIKFMAKLNPPIKIED